MQELIQPTVLPDIAILAGQIRDSSKRMYARDIVAYAAYAQQEQLDPLSAATLRRWVATLAGKDHQAQYSPHTINRMLAAVKRLMREGAEQGLISRDLAVQFADQRGVKIRALKERLRSHARTYIAPADMRRLAELPDTNSIKGARDAALLHTLASSGVRVSEVASLKVADIQWIEQNGKRGYFLLVCGKTDETSRQAPLSTEAYQAIMTWLAARPVPSEYVFTANNGRGNRWSARPMTSQALEALAQHYAEALGLEHVKPHDFRRFVGTQLARVDIRKAQLALGHKSIETTARHYDLGKLEPGLTDGLY
jgi:site-specific recombinase XerD